MAASSKCWALCSAAAQESTIRPGFFACQRAYSSASSAAGKLPSFWPNTSAVSSPSTNCRVSRAAQSAAFMFFCMGYASPPSSAAPRPIRLYISACAVSSSLSASAVHFSSSIASSKGFFTCLLYALYIGLSRYYNNIIPDSNERSARHGFPLHAIIRPPAGGVFPARGRSDPRQRRGHVRRHAGAQGAPAAKRRRERARRALDRHARRDCAGAVRQGGYLLSHAGSAAGGGIKALCRAAARRSPARSPGAGVVLRLYAVRGIGAFANRPARQLYHPAG